MFDEKQSGNQQASARSEDLHDVLIIGGGPAGGTAALYCARAGLSTMVVDKGSSSGALGMAGQIANYPGFTESLPGIEVVTRIRKHAEQYGANFVVDRVTASNIEGKTKQAWGAKGAYQGRALIIATGSMGRSSTIPGEEEYVGRGVSYCATCDGFFFADQTVAVAGGTDEAVEEAIFLARFAGNVHLLVPSEELSCGSDLRQAIEEHPKVQIHPSTRLRQINGDDKVTSVTVRTRNEQDRTLEVSGVFIYLQGGKPIVDFLAGQLPLSPDGCLMVDDMAQTAVPGVFAAGDVLCKHVKQAIIAAAEGARAAIGADRYLAGRERFRPDWA